MTNNLKIDKVQGGTFNEIDFTYMGYDYNLFIGVIKSKVGETRGECFLRFDDDQILALLNEYMEIEHNKGQLAMKGNRQLKRKQKELVVSWGRIVSWIRGYVQSIVPKP
jgi:hypothetical protein